MEEVYTVIQTERKGVRFYRAIGQALIQLRACTL